MYQYGERVITQPTEKFLTPSLSNESLDIKKPAARRCAKLMQSHPPSNSRMAVYMASHVKRAYVPCPVFSGFVDLPLVNLPESVGPRTGGQ